MNRIQNFTILLLFFSFISLSQLSAQSSTVETSSETVVASIGNHSILMEDLVRYYERNNLDAGYTTEDLQEFLPYYVDFELKLAYGREQGLHEDPDVQNEFNSYSKQAAFSYWLQNEIKKEMMDEFVERSGYELKSSHVLIQLDEKSPTAEVEEARMKIEEAREKFKNGELTMAELDREYSSLIQGRPAGGELPWFSVGVTVKPFEDALFSLEPGEISEPVRTQFGYHLIYLEDKRVRTPDRKVSHIFFRGSRGELSAEQLSGSAFDALEEDRPWDEVVQEFSQDGASVNTSGEIGWIGYGTQFSAEFIDVVMGVDPEQAYSEPVQSNYGYHIFRIDSVRTYEDEDQKRRELTAQIEELPRFSASPEQVLQRLAEVGNFTVNESTKERVEQFFKSSNSKEISSLRMPRRLSRSTLITFNNMEYSARDFMNWLLETNPDRSADSYSSLWLEMYEESILDSEVINMTRERFPDFDSEIEGFLNGLIVFQVSDDNIWSSETVDSTALKAFYEEHKDRYQYEHRYDFTLIASRSDSALAAASEHVQNGLNPDEFIDQFDNLLARRDSVSTPGEEIQGAIENLAPGDRSETFRYRNRDAYVFLHQILEPRTMTFDEAFHRVNSDYQPIREEIFITDLRERFDVRVYPDRIQ